MADSKITVTIKYLEIDMQRTPSKVNHWINIQSTCSVTWSWKEAFIEYLVMISHKVFPYIQLLNSSKVKVPTLAKHYSGKCNKLWHVKKFFFKSEKHLNQELYRNHYKLSVILTYLLLITTTETQKPSFRCCFWVILNKGSTTSQNFYF